MGTVFTHYQYDNIQYDFASYDTELFKIYHTEKTKL